MNNSDPRLNTSKQQRELSALRQQLSYYKSAFVASDKEQFRCVGYRNLEWHYYEPDNSITVTGEVWLKRKPKMPNNIASSVDGVCQAVIYRKDDYSEIETILVPLPDMGVGITSDIKTIYGVKRNVKCGDISNDVDSYGIALIDYRTSAIEEKQSFINRAKSSDDESI